MNKKNRMAKIAFAAFVLSSSIVTSTQAIPLLSGQTVTPYILAGALPDTPAARVDANLASSPYSGVVSINIRYNAQSFICSGTLVGTRQVVTAGHCVDTNGNGRVIDVSQPFSTSGNDVRVVFNATGSGAGAAVVNASAVSINPNYAGFGNCPVGVPGFCVNDDVAVITLAQDAPADAKIYRLFSGDLGLGQLVNLAGYGTSGDGINGFNVDANFRIKRSGSNVLDLFEGNDEALTGFDSFGFLQGLGRSEVWFADFDGTNSRGLLKDSNCTVFLVCTQQLANGVETNIGGGDSGGPTFIDINNELFLVGDNTFGWSGFGEERRGAFGSLFGGILLGAYTDYLFGATNGAIQIVSNVPEPGTLALFGLGFAMLPAMRKRKQ